MAQTTYSQSFGKELDFKQLLKLRDVTATLQAATFAKTLAAAYDLRSHYVHTGKAFADWVRAYGDPPPEVHHGQPIVEDKAFGRILANSPTFPGLERVVRYGLLAFAQDRLGVRLRDEEMAVVHAAH